MSRHPRYPAYRDSGIAWLGAIPAGWGVKRLKYHAGITFSNVDKHSIEGELSIYLCNYVDVYKNDFINASIEFMQATASADEIARFALRRGDVIITKDSESWQDIAIPAYVEADLDGVLCGYHLALIRRNSNRLDGRYLFRALQSNVINYQFATAATGITRYGLGKNAIDNGLIPLPPLPEQQAIAAYLDAATARIDALVAHKQQLIALLHERRTALISHAVTRGLDPSAPLRDSGIAWLGAIPAGWGVKRLKYVAVGLLQYGANEVADSDDPDNPRYIRITDIDESGALREDTFRTLDKVVAKPYMLDDGDLLFARSGATVGKQFSIDES
ncbi:MAG: hypothetical protein HC911_17025, partial [Chloroflexaceae bacterium]|nr:hypothetical protein [Chloroflexaceae bacterium]